MVPIPSTIQSHWSLLQDLHKNYLPKDSETPQDKDKIKPLENPIMSEVIWPVQERMVECGILGLSTERRCFAALAFRICALALGFTSTEPLVAKHQANPFRSTEKFLSALNVEEWRTFYQKNGPEERLGLIREKTNQVYVLTLTKIVELSYEVFTLPATSSSEASVKPEHSYRHNLTCEPLKTYKTRLLGCQGSAVTFLSMAMQREEEERPFVLPPPPSQHTSFPLSFPDSLFLPPIPEEGKEERKEAPSVSFPMPTLPSFPSSYLPIPDLPSSTLLSPLEVEDSAPLPPLMPLLISPPSTTFFPPFPTFPSAPLPSTLPSRQPLPSPLDPTRPSFPLVPLQKPKELPALSLTKPHSRKQPQRRPRPKTKN